MSMRLIVVLPVILILIGLLVYLIVISAKKGKSGLKLMLLGIQITLIGGIIAVDPDSNLDGIEYLIVLIGLVFSIVGLNKNE